MFLQEVTNRNMMYFRIFMKQKRPLLSAIMRGESRCTESEKTYVQFTETTKRGIITLNRPEHLNALNLSMLQKIYPKLTEWGKTKELITIEGNGEKAFCAGGDVIEATTDKTGEFGKCFFRLEYENNGRIASLKVPYVALISGILMGGGVGLSLLGKYRVATETSLFAMPEASIGLFPDAGVSHFLSRIPRQLGMFLALTGYRLTGFDLIHTEIATHYCHTTLLPELRRELLCEGNNVGEVLKKLQKESVAMFPNGVPPNFILCKHEELIEHCFSAESFASVIERLSYCDCDEFADEIFELFCTACPVSLLITFKQMRMAEHLDVYEVLNNDYRIVCRMLEGMNFYEGVRACLLDKDKSPRWVPDSTKKIAMEEIDKYFEPLGRNELNLPQAIRY